MADKRLPLLALCLRVAGGLFALGAAASLLATPAVLQRFRPVVYSAAGLGVAGGLAQLVPPGNTPDASAFGRDMTVSWTESFLTGGTPASGYVLNRFDVNGVAQTILDDCGGVITALWCIEQAVPSGEWTYTVTPVFGSWTGTASLKSAVQVTSAATLTLMSSIVPTLPTTLTGTVNGFATDEAITFHLDSTTGPVLDGTPATVPAGGTADVTVTIPVGTDDSPHSVFVVGDQGTLASHAITVIDPPVLTALQMIDTNANGKIDSVSVVFSKTLAAYTAGTTPWTLSGVPSGGTLTAVSVSGTTATLTLTEGGGAADTAVGSFTVALAANAAGIRDAAAQTGSFAATAPTDMAAPVATLLKMFDTNANGKIDSATIAFSETAATYTAANSVWTLSGVPSGGTLTSVSVTASTATLTLTEGAGPADTAVGSFTIALATNAAGVRDTAGNLSSFVATAPVDKATPARMSMVMTDSNANGKVDHVVITFSETLATYTAGITGWTLTSTPSTDTLASVTASGATVTLNLNEGAGGATTAVGSFTITLATNAGGVRDAATNLVSWAATAPADGAKPILVSLNMNDSVVNGKVDQVTAVFTETLGTSVTPTTAPWTLTGVPSGGTLASVSVATTTATLTITEGAGAADTTVGSFTLALAAVAGGVQDPSGNLASFGTTVPADKAKPARLSMVMNDVDANGKVDQVVMTFSETLSTYTAGNTGWTFVSLPSTDTLASVTASGTTVTLNLNEGAGLQTTAVGSFTIALTANAAGIRDAAANLTTWAATAPTDGAKPVLLTLNMNDSNTNGKVDQVTAVFTETLGTYTAGVTPWTITGVPSGGTLASVTTATTTATLTITEGAGAADTTVGSFTIAMAANAAGVKDAAGNLASFGTTVPLDKAKPARLSMVMNDVDANGKVDQVAMTFSEPLAAYSAGTTGWTLTSPPSTATLASVSTSGATAILNLAEGPAAATTALGSFKVTLAANAAGIRDAAGNQTSWASTAPTDGAKPVLLTLTMTDTNFNGKVDHAAATFSEALSTYTAANVPWTLTNVPSGGVLASVAMVTPTATLTITEGAGAADTTVGSFTVAMATSATGIRDAAGNLASFTATAPADKAAPARLTMLMNDTNGNGRVDQVAMTFSEPLDTYTAGITPWTFVGLPSAATFASLTTSGSTATLALTEGAGAPNTAVGTFTIAMAANAAGIRDIAANATSWAAVAPTDKATPVLVTLTMTDTTLNGKVDHAVAVFSETLSAYTAGNTPWTLTGVPSNGTLASVAVATTTATLTITEGAGAADTTVGSFTIALATSATGIRDAANNFSSFTTMAPADKSAPARLTMLMNDTNGNGRVDQLAMTFSEPLDTYTAGSTPWTFAVAPSGATFGSLTTSGSTATLGLTEGAGAPNTAVGTFTIAMAANAGGIRDTAANTTSWAAVAPTDKAAPGLVSLTMTDTNANGKVDHVTAVFSETLSASTLTAPWTLANVPSGGTLASVAVATTTATLTITEGAGAADTSVGSFTIALATNAAGTRDAANNLSSFAASAPADSAAPLRLSMLMNDTNGNGRVDQVTMTFSEPLDTYTAGSTPWTLVAAPSGATFGLLTTSGSTATLTLIEGAGAPNTAVGSFTIAMAANAAGIRDTSANAISWAAVAPTDKAAPALVSLTMTDTNANGKVDHAVAVFSEPLSAYTSANVPWTLTNIPSGGVLASVAVLTPTVTLTLIEGAGAPDTAVGSFTVAMATSATGIRDAANNLATFAATAPADGAGPVAVSVSSTDSLTHGRIEVADSITITFSEALDPASVPSVTTVTEADPTGAGNDTLTITGITLGAQNTGSDSYISLDGGIVDFASSTVALTNANTTITVTVGGACQNTGCGGIGQALIPASLTFAPAATLTDSAGKPAVGTRTDVILIF